MVPIRCTIRSLLHTFLEQRKCSAVVSFFVIHPCEGVRDRVDVGEELFRLLGQAQSEVKISILLGIYPCQFVGRAGEARINRKCLFVALSCLFKISLIQIQVANQSPKRRKFWLKGSSLFEAFYSRIDLSTLLE